MMIASEVAKLAEVSADVVRYYSRTGLLNPTRNPDNGYRIYTPRDVNRVRFVYVPIYNFFTKRWGDRA
jgi:MerR family Zn(II)-responsive transcriptional regulator of zntA